MKLRHVGRTAPKLRPGRARLWPTVATGVVFVSVLGATPARAQVEGLEVEATTTYRLDPQAEVVRAKVEADLTSTLPSRRSGGIIETPYFHTFGFPVLGHVENLRARSSSGEQLGTRVDERRGFNVAEVDLSPALVHGDPQSITVDFDLPGQPSRSDTVTRINDAFAGWSAYGVGDPGHVDVVIDVPESFEVSLTRPVSPAVSKRDGRRIYRIENVSDLEDAALFATARADESLDDRDLTVLGRTVTVEAWPNDPKWADFAMDTVEDGLPALEDLIGQPLPDGELSVVESTGAYQLGYAGVYDLTTGVVEVGDELDDRVLLHELSHVWLNHELFVGRWITEGLAQEVADRAVVELGESADPPDAVETESAGAVQLNEWAEVGLLDPERVKVDAFAYNASYAVVHDLVEEIGIDGLREVLATASDHAVAYQGDGDPGRSPVRDWRYFYDLVERAGASEDALDLVARHALTDEQIASRDHRVEARAAFDDLVATGEGWAAPTDVREQMARWRFDEAEELIAQSHDLLDRALALGDSLEPFDVDPGSALQPEYETASSLDTFDETLEDFERVGAELNQAHRERDDAGLVARLGLLTSGDQWVSVNDAYEQGDLEDAEIELARAVEATTRATERGATFMVGLLLLLVATASFVPIRGMRLRRREP